MRDAFDPRAPWEQVLAEIRRMREETLRREDELWDAVEEIRCLVADARPQAGSGRRSAPADADPHRLDQGSYRTLKRRLRRFVARAVPDGGRVAVVSRGDDELLELSGCETEHYPRDREGAYLGFYPLDGTAAIAHLEWVRAEGAAYLLFPATALWWLEHFPRFAAHLESRFPRFAAREGVGALYDIRSGSLPSETPVQSIQGLLDAWEDQGGTAPSLLDWHTGADLTTRLPGRTVFEPIRSEPPLPYLDGSVDVVAVRDASPTVMDEARRIAARSVVRLPGPPGSRMPEGSAALLEHIDDPPPDLPSVSVVVPTHDGVRHLVPCLRALGETLPRGSDVEILVVDDASGPETAAILRQLERAHGWLRVIRNDLNGGFITSCNRGAREARGQYLVFLNDDTVPLPGWLSSLLRTFRAHPEAGAVGGRLVYPDGRLQEAGGVLYEDGRGANVGRDDPEVDAPLYLHLRPVHYCSGALLATPRALFLQLGGFDTRYDPAYYEDADYCFSVRQAGLEVYYQPEAVVVHVEGASSGTDVRSGVKRHQLLNRTTFEEKWRERLRTLGPAPDTYTAETWHRLVFRGALP